MDDEALQQAIEELAKSLPKFPDGRIDYTNAKIVYGVSIVVQHQDKILFLKRAADLHFYPHLWSVASGFIDEPIPLRETVLKELQEETGITEDQIDSIAFAQPRQIKDPVAGRQWHIYPALVKLKQKTEITINWEHTEYCWIYPNEVTNFDRLPGVEENIRLALALA